MKRYIVDFCNIVNDILDIFKFGYISYSFDNCFIEKDYTEKLSIFFKDNNKYSLYLYKASNRIYFKMKIIDFIDTVVLDFYDGKYNEYFVFNIDFYNILEAVLKELIKNNKKEIKNNINDINSYKKDIEDSILKINIKENSNLTNRQIILKEFLKNIYKLFENNKYNISKDNINYIYKNDYINWLDINESIRIYSRDYTFELKVNDKFIIEFNYNRITYEKVRLKNEFYKELNDIILNFLNYIDKEI